MGTVTSRVIEGGVTFVTQPYHTNGQYGYDYEHWGIDLVSWNGYNTCLAWITAHSDGKVVALRNDCTGFEYNSYGNYVLLQHSNGTYTVYAHLYYGTVQVYVGQTVKKGQRLGYMDNSGTSDGGHLHWEVRLSNGYQCDPEAFLNRELPNKWVTAIYGGWYYVENGAINYNYNGVAQNENGWWKITNGKVDFGFTGLAQNDNGWWYLKDGKVDFSYNGLVQNNMGWWAVVNGKVDFSYNGLRSNEHGWWMLQGGKVDFDYNGLCVNENGTWVLKGGKVDFDFTGDYKFSGTTYKVQKGKVVS